MPKFRNSLRVSTDGMSGWNLFRTLFWDLLQAVTFVRDLIARKRVDPQDDILTALIQAEEQGEQLTEDELVSMVFLLIFAGYETTVHLITNGVVTLLQHPDQLAHLRTQPELLASAVEEILRYNGPVQGTKPGYAVEDVTLHGVTIPKGSAVVLLLGAANHDPAAFHNPAVFDVARAQQTSGVWAGDTLLPRCASRQDGNAARAQKPAGAKSQPALSSETRGTEDSEHSVVAPL